MSWIRAAAVAGSIALLLSPALAATTTGARSIPPRKPDLFIKIKQHSGACPKTLGVWTWAKFYEGGGTNFVVADTAALAGPAMRTKFTKTVAEFSATLDRRWASCVGDGLNQDLNYSVRASGGRIRFRVELQPTADHPALFVDASIVKSRPFVEWGVAD
jgi:hypothetical protein